MKILDKTIDNGFYRITNIETYKNFIRFIVDFNTVSDELKEIVADIMCSDMYDNYDNISMSVIIPFKRVLDFNDAILHISEISHTLREEYINQLVNTIANNEMISGNLGVKIEFNTIELVNLLSAA